jgi:hypothetical protein
MHILFSKWSFLTLFSNASYLLLCRFHLLMNLLIHDSKNGLSDSGVESQFNNHDSK